MIAAAFDTAGKLFGLTFQPRTDIPVYHPDVRVWEVSREGKIIGLFYGDYYARAGKQGGAWMSSLRDQQTLDGEVLPLITNNCNFIKGDPALLSLANSRFRKAVLGPAPLLTMVALPAVLDCQKAVLPASLVMVALPAVLDPPKPTPVEKVSGPRKSGCSA